MKIVKIIWAALAGAALLLSAAVAADRIDLPVGNAPTIGPASAPVTMIEFVDYQ